MLAEMHAQDCILKLIPGNFVLVRCDTAMRLMPVHIIYMRACRLVLSSFL